MFLRINSSFTLLGRKATGTGKEKEAIKEKPGPKDCSPIGHRLGVPSEDYGEVFERERTQGDSIRVALSDHTWELGYQGPSKDKTGSHLWCNRHVRCIFSQLTAPCAFMKHQVCILNSMQGPWLPWEESAPDG